MVQNNSRSKARMFSFTTDILLVMSDALEEHDGKVDIGGRNISSLWFADERGALADEEQELEALAESLDNPAQGVRWRSVLKRPK